MHQSNIYETNNRMPELDLARGIGILVVILIHIPFMLDCFTDANINWHWSLNFVRLYGGVFFVFVSGISMVLCHKSFKRGLIVFLCGMLLTGITYYLYLSGIEGSNVLIRFGVLHLIGFAMMLYPLYKKLPTWALLVLGLAIVIYGYSLNDIRVVSENLFFLGYKSMHFYDFDIFPIFPQLGWHMLGVCFGRIVYKERVSTVKSLLTTHCPFLRFLCFVGRHTLEIYLLHLPILYIIVKSFA